MAKARRSRIKELEKKLEALENQGFAQKLLIDELENKVESLEKRVADSMPFIPYYQPAQPFQIQQPTLPLCNHVWSDPDSAGMSHCTLCGQTSSTRIIYTTGAEIKIQDCSWLPDWNVINKE